MIEAHDEVGKFALEREVDVRCVYSEVKPERATTTNVGALIP